MSDSQKPFHYGGQAVIEGVMMRGREFFAVACRKKSNGEIVTSCEPVMTAVKKLEWLKKPLLRGTLALVDAMALGMKTLTFSANVAMADEEAMKNTVAVEPPSESVTVDPQSSSSPKQAVVNSIAIGFSMVLALAIGLGLFVAVPAILAAQLKPWVASQHMTEFGGRAVRGLVEGGLKFLFLLGYVSVISTWGEIRRIFQYHGAEHKTINAYEAGEPLDVEHVQKYSTVHVRCGTSFLLVVVMVSIVVFAFISWESVMMRIVYKLILMPLVAGIAYEIIHLAGGHKESRLMRGLLSPGLLMQRITTKEPSDDQVEVAIKSLQLVLQAEGKIPAPAGEVPSS